MCAPSLTLSPKARLCVTLHTCPLEASGCSHATAWLLGLCSMAGVFHRPLWFGLVSSAFTHTVLGWFPGGIAESEAQEPPRLLKLRLGLVWEL